MNHIANQKSTNEQTQSQSLNSNKDKGHIGKGTFSIIDNRPEMQLQGITINAIQRATTIIQFQMTEDEIIQKLHEIETQAPQEQLESLKTCLIEAKNGKFKKIVNDIALNISILELFLELNTLRSEIIDFRKAGTSCMQLAQDCFQILGTVNKIDEISHSTRLNKHQIQSMKKAIGDCKIKFEEKKQEAVQNALKAATTKQALEHDKAVLQIDFAGNALLKDIVEHLLLNENTWKINLDKPYLEVDIIAAMYTWQSHCNLTNLIEMKAPGLSDVKKTGHIEPKVRGDKVKINTVFSVFLISPDNSGLLKFQIHVIVAELLSYAQANHLQGSIE